MGATEVLSGRGTGRRTVAPPWSRLKRLAARQPLTLLGSVILALIAMISLFPFMFATHLPLAIDADRGFLSPSWQHFFGTDELGRDIYSRVIYGVRLSLGSGLGVVLIAILIGTPLGLLSGFRGGKTDTTIMRVADLFIAFPSLIMAMAIVAFLGRNLTNAMLALSITWWPQYARLARGQTLAVREQPFVEAAHAVGARESHIVRRHILPNMFSPVLVKGTLDVGLAILYTASLSFLGLGAQPPSPELGAMVTAGRVHLLTSWWYATMPGLMIFIIVLPLNLVGDGVRDLLDPVLRGRL
ncbi:MAG: ABC transporter permease [Armatimonadota bacterium]